jgi:predicted Zn-ribbon and HTH transcriptional regulator
MENRENTEWKVIRDEEDEDELVNADWLVVDQSGELVANVHGRTVGDCITNADLIAMAPAMRRALHRIAHCDDTRTVGEDVTLQIQKRLSEAIEIAESVLRCVTPCPRCGYCGFIEDAAMNLAGVCPECNGAGRAIIRHNAAMEPPSERKANDNT